MTARLTTQKCDIGTGEFINKSKIYVTSFMDGPKIDSKLMLPEPMSTKGRKTLKVKKMIKSPKCR